MTIASIDTIVVTLAALAGLVVVARTLTRAWERWLEWKRLELERSGGGDPVVSSRIEMSDLRERLRKLEAIAAGVDL
ncbi:hypothetical protein [Novosphingobium olei]|uniref:Phage shock protein B n=1 Tax=Novosphingobium olei TaxID=2728851 RepID=A0A7Y0BMW2_9SPHN|nr:hypothetical protein [Novosphingobium olei]NML93118.1 hypothetical protein [Novosphingobium olei]BEU99679.1 hypothetical protein NSDW_07740 [Novosphingobium olei]